MICAIFINDLCYLNKYTCDLHYEHNIVIRDQKSLSKIVSGQNFKLLLTSYI